MGEVRSNPRVHGPVPETDQFYIRTPSTLADEHDLVLKQGDTFVVLDRYGDIRPVGLAEQGLYHDGTRHLSRLSLRIGGQPALLLSSAVKQDNALIAVDLTNLDVSDEGVLMIPRGTVHLSRVIVLWDGVFYERLRLRNYGAEPFATTLVVGFDADYADIFEVRGSVRPRRGERLRPVVGEHEVVLAYRGLDDVIRRTRITIDPAPSVVAATGAMFALAMAPAAEVTYELTFACERDGAPRKSLAFGRALDTATRALAERRAETCEIVTSNHQVNEWLKRSLADLSMMTTDTPQGPYPYAGVPWFSTCFGRDGIITALQCLWANPAMARGVLAWLAATQATGRDPERDAQPGKILHETRSGEMAALGEIPFGCYYGSHDATPLFVMLAAEYYERTADLGFIDHIWPNIEAALGWIERDGDPDGDGFAEYLRQSPTGLEQQGWKDSHDAVFHADGRPAEGPIALCEIQGYVYAAWRGGARLARLLGHEARAAALASKADTLRARFDAAFWCPAIGSYALALDGRKQQCRVRASNAGHTLFTNLAEPQRAVEVATTLLGPESYSGWGIRTIASSEARFNPMSYHNGSVWPHDNALIAAGFARYGLRDAALTVFSGLFDASLFVDLHRLPELFCGFTRRAGESPTLYPVACNPQAWASGSVFLLLQAALGLEIHSPERRICFSRAKLPPFIEEVHIRNLRVGAVRVDLALQRHDDDVGIHVLRRQGDIEIVAIK